MSRGPRISMEAIKSMRTMAEHGMKAKEIAGILNITQDTISTYLRAMDNASRGEAVRSKPSRDTIIQACREFGWPDPVFIDYEKKDEPLPFTDIPTEAEAQAAAEAETDETARASRMLAKDLGELRKAVQKQKAEAEQIDMATFLQEEHNRTVDDFMRIATVQLQAQTTLLDAIRAKLESIGLIAGLSN